MGLWLGCWPWCSNSSVSVGSFIGTLVIEGVGVAWDFWTSLILLMTTLLLNIVVLEVRRSPFRRTVADAMGDEGRFSRVSRGENKMHLMSTGPY
jgi:hypothetical protein